MYTSRTDGDLPSDAATPPEVLDMLDEVYYYLTPEGEVLAWNDRLPDVTGYGHEAIEEMDATDFFGAPDRGTIADAIDAVVSDGEQVVVEAALLTEDGETIPYEFSGNPVSDEDGEVTGIVGIGRDISDRKETERQIKRTRDFLDDVIEAVPHPLYVLDVEDYEIQRANSRAVAREGQTCYGVTHRREMPCHEGDGATFSCPLQEVVETAEATTVEHTHYETAEDKHVHEVHAAPIVDDEGTVVAMVESLVDITDRKEYEQLLKEQRDDLDVLNQVLRHDIRNDLQLVTAYADLLADEVDEDAQEYLDIVRESADHAVELTTTARDMADVMLRDTYVEQRISLRGTLESELDAVRSTYSDAAVTVEGTLPAVDVLASDMLDSVFRNLLKNAVQHNDKDLPRVTVSATARDETVVVRIADNGPGVPDDRKADVFGRGESGLQSRGTGIGLYLVQTLVENAGGDVRIEDNEPEGAVFVVELPRAE